MENRILKLKEVIYMTQIPKSTIYMYMKTGYFPKQVKLTKSSVGWRYKDIKEFLDNLKHSE